MPVTIGEVEVLPDAPAAAATPAAAPQPAPLDAAELQRLLAHLHAQALRLWAH